MPVGCCVTQNVAPPGQPRSLLVFVFTGSRIRPLYGLDPQSQVIWDPLRKVAAVIMTKVAQRTVTETRVFAGRPIFGAAGLVHYKSSTRNVGAKSIGSTGWRTLCDCIAIRDCEKCLLRFSCSKPQLRARAAESLPSSARQIFPLASYLQSLQDRPSLNGTHVDVDTHLLTKLGSWRLRMTDP